MPVPTVAFSCRVVPEVQEAIRRLCALTRWSQSSGTEQGDRVRKLFAFENRPTLPRRTASLVRCTLMGPSNMQIANGNFAC